MNNPFTGMGVALVTPFTQDGAVDYASLEKIINYQLGNGADFLCILATTGETPTLTAEECADIRQFIIKTVGGRVPLLLGCGGNNTTAVCERLCTDDFKGIDGILSVCPYYNKPSQEGLFQHFRAIAAATTLPIVLYNVPGRTGVNMEAETTIRLARECENIVAIKEASGKMDQILQILEGKPSDFDVLSGDDGLALEMINHGAKGVISVIGNALTGEFSRLIRLALEGRVEEAEKINVSLSELYRLLFVDGNPAGIKVIMEQQGLLTNVLRLPLVKATEATQKAISIILKHI